MDLVDVQGNSKLGPHDPSNRNITGCMIVQSPSPLLSLLSNTACLTMQASSSLCLVSCEELFGSRTHPVGKVILITQGHRAVDGERKPGEVQLQLETLETSQHHKSCNAAREENCSLKLLHSPRCLASLLPLGPARVSRPSQSNSSNQWKHCLGNFPSLPSSFPLRLNTTTTTPTPPHTGSDISTGIASGAQVCTRTLQGLITIKQIHQLYWLPGVQSLCITPIQGRVSR